MMGEPDAHYRVFDQEVSRTRFTAVAQPPAAGSQIRVGMMLISG
jgi:hypothetical protein